MVVSPENLAAALKKYDDPNATYTAEEEKAIQQFFDLVDADEELKIWRKYTIKSFAAIALRACNLDAAVAYKSLKDIHALATKTYPNLLGLIDPIGLKPIIERKIFQVVKRNGNNGPAILVVRVGNWHISDGTIEEVSCAVALYMWALLKKHPEIEGQGLLVIQDMSGFKLKHARQVTIDLVKMALKFHACVPPSATTLMKGIVAFNSFTLVEETYNLFKGILPKDIKKLVHITKNDASVITKLVDSPSQLPAEFGGTIPDEEAYMDGLEQEILGDADLFDIMKQLQDEVLQTYGIKRAEKKRKEKKDKKDKKDKQGKVEGQAVVA